jgi:hypothetical protein
MLELNPQYLQKNGKDEFVILPIEEFQKIQALLKDFQPDLKVGLRNPSIQRKAGSAKHLITIPDNFYEPLESFQEYSSHLS